MSTRSPYNEDTLRAALSKVPLPTLDMPARAPFPDAYRWHTRLRGHRFLLLELIRMNQRGYDPRAALWSLGQLLNEAGTSGAAAS